MSKAVWEINLEVQIHVLPMARFDLSLAPGVSLTSAAQCNLEAHLDNLGVLVVYFVGERLFDSGCTLSSGRKSGQPWCSCGRTLLAKASPTLRGHRKTWELACWS
jgi:hypothetical protein